MHNQKPRNFRPRPQKSGFRRRPSSSRQNSNGHHFQNNSGNTNFNRNGSMTNPYNVEKTIEKYQQLAKDAQSLGDPVVVENYLQHADHYTRRLSELNTNKTATPIKEKEEPLKETATPIKEKEEPLKEKAEPLKKK